MGRPIGWARCLDNVADVLRRGAWYPIVEATADKVVIEVRQRPVRLSRIDVSVRDTPPDHWSIVVRTGVLRPTLGGREGEDVITRIESRLVGNLLTRRSCEAGNCLVC